MSDIATKPEEVKPAVATEAPKVEEAAPVAPSDTVVPVVETTATTADATVAEAKTEEKPEESKTEGEAKEEETKEEKPEPKEITQGILSKNHGGLLAFFKQKRFFYFQDEAIPDDKLKSYLHKESHSKATAAFATQTGKGLLLYSKDEHNKIPHGIIKLADVTDVVPVGATKFVLKQGPHNDLHFEAPAPERDSWVFTLKSKIADAKTAVEAITESEEYKAALEKFTKPPVVAAKAVEKPEEKEAESEEAKVDTADKTEATTPAAEGEGAEAKDVKRSESTSKKAKRTSVFTFFDKKEKSEEKKDEKKEEPKEEAKTDENKDAETPAVAAVAEPVAETTEAVKSDKETEEAKPSEAKPAEATSPKEAASPKTTKRLSFFGGFNKKKAEAPAAEKKEEEKVDAPAAETETPAATEPVETESKPLEVPAEISAPDKNAAASPTHKSKFNLSSFIKREKSSAPKAEKAEDKAEEAAESKVEDKTESEVADKAEPEAKPASEPVAETAKETSAEEAPAEAPATSPKETKRKSSFFSGFKGKKADESKGEEVTSDSEAPKAASPVSKFSGLVRKVSRSSSKTPKDAEKEKEVAAPATVTEEPETAVSAEPVKTEAEPAPEPAATQSIGDVVPDAVNVGQAPVKASA